MFFAQEDKNINKCIEWNGFHRCQTFARWLQRGRVIHWPRFCLSLPVQVWIGSVVTEEKHNRAPVQLCALHSSITSRAFPSTQLLRAINATQLQCRVLFSVKAAWRHWPQRSRGTSYTSPVSWKQQSGIKAVSNQDETFLLSSQTPRSDPLTIPATGPLIAAKFILGKYLFFVCVCVSKLRNFLGVKWESRDLSIGHCVLL